jgi:neutral ceramidase
MSDGMAISIGKSVITPPVGTPLAGFGVDTPRLSTGNNAPLYARCTILWDNGYPNVIVSADVLGFPRSVNQSIRTKVTALGIAKSDFILTGTHTHNGGALIDELVPFIAYNVAAGSPAMTAIQTYTTSVQNAVVNLVSSTLAAPRTPCTLDYQVANENFAYNREGLSYVEQDVPILTARNAAGVPLAVLFGYGCHPVCAGGQTLSDPDYPGVACALIEKSTSAQAQFLIGPAGDQDPVGNAGWSLSSADGSDLGQTVVNALAGPIDTAYQDITVPFDITNTPANLATVRAEYVARQGNSSLPGYVRRHAQTMIGQIDAHSFATSLKLPLQTWSLQGSPGLYLALTGGELVSGFAVYFRSRYGGSSGIWINGYSNELPAYIPSNELLSTGGALHYACGWDTDYTGIAGGSMTVYGWLGHFVRPPNTPTNGVEQLVTSGLTGML